MHPVAAAGFGAGAAVYERARPSYPQEAIDWIVDRTGLGRSRTVVDVGAGTGKLTRLLVATGARVIAVEPVAEMRAKLEEVLPGVEALDGTAESMPLADGTADVITAAQAFHWFDRERAFPELHRVLAPDGFLVLIWNSRDLDDPLQSAVEDVLAPLRGSVVWEQSFDWQPEVERSPLFGPVEPRTFVLDQRLTIDELAERVASTSFVAAMTEAEQAPLLARVRALVAGAGEPFSFRYRTEVFVIARGTSNEG